jgi:hypothetical protein
MGLDSFIRNGRSLGMSKSTRTMLLGLAVLALLAGGIYLYTANVGPAPAVLPADPVTSLDRWVERTQRPGFVLLDKVDLEDYYICVYDTGSREVALCYRWKSAQDEPDTSLLVKDADNRSLQDSSRWNTQTQLNETGPIAGNAYVQGMVTPIPQGYRGPIRVVFRDNHGSPDNVPARNVYEKTLDFGE